MRQWQKWIKILENNPKKSLRELAKEFNKNHTWVHFLKTFYNAPAEEKEKLKDTHPQYAYFYKVWKKENNINEITVFPQAATGNRQEKQKNTLPRIPYYQIEDLKKVIMRIALENKHLIEENNAFAEDNIAKACSINQLINEKNSLQQEIKDLKLDLKITKYSYYAVIVAAIFLIIGGIKCLA